MSVNFATDIAEGHEPPTEGDIGDTEPACERTPQQALAEIADAYRQAVLDLLAGPRKRSEDSGPVLDADAAQGPAEPERSEDASQ